MNKETQEEDERKREFHRVINKIRNLQKPNETGQGTSRQQTGEIQPDSEIPELEDAETMSSGSENTIAVPVINFKRYLGATGVRYINMGKASKIQINSDWDLEETVRQVEQKFVTDLKPIAGETTNNEKLLKTLVCIERKTMEQTPEEYKGSTKHLSTRFGVVFYDDKIIIPQTLRRTIITLIHKGHPAINKMCAAAKPFWWPKLTKEIQNKCDECIPCEMTARSETLQVYSSNNGDGEYDQLIMKSPRKLKGDNPLSRPRGENRRGPDGKFAQKSSPQVEDEDTEEKPEEIKPEELEEQEPSTPNTSIETLDDSFDFAAPIQVGRGRKKQPQSTKTNTPGKDNLKIHVENMNEEQQAMETRAENPRNVTIIVNNGNTIEKIINQQTESQWEQRQREGEKKRNGEEKQHKTFTGGEKEKTKKNTSTRCYLCL